MVEPVSLRAGKGYDSLMRPSRDPLRLRPIEVLGIVAGWTFVGALAAIGRVYDPRVPLLRSDVNTALLALSFIEYAIWALLTAPLSGSQHALMPLANTGSGAESPSSFWVSESLSRSTRPYA
jgi:hypothetical protein